MSAAAEAALKDSGLERSEVDGLICGYSTTLPHLMLAALFAEHFGLQPAYAHAIQLGGASGGAMAMLAHHLVRSGAAQNILVVAGENRLSGQTRDTSIQTLAQVGHPVYEAPLGATVPAYYALLASHYLHQHRLDESALAEAAVLMRRSACRTPGAHLSTPITVEDVLASKMVASPLHLLDCCPISDGGAAFVVSAARRGGANVRILGGGQAHCHQHISAAPSLERFGADLAVTRAEAAAGVRRTGVDYVAVYDSFTITLTLLLEEIGLAPRGQTAAQMRDGYFDPTGPLPLNTHGGLLSYGHCGVAGAMAHFVEAVLQLGGRAGPRQAGSPRLALLHADGGVLSSHVSLFLERV